MSQSCFFWIWPFQFLRFRNPKNNEQCFLQVLQEEAGLYSRAWWELALCTARLSGTLLLTTSMELSKGKLSKLSKLETCFARSLTYAFQPVFGLPTMLHVLSFVLRSGSAITNTIVCYSHCLLVCLYSAHHLRRAVEAWVWLYKKFWHKVWHPPDRYWHKSQNGF